MKIGIMTYWCWDNNYGSQLQCWALQQVLKRMGHNPYLIRYDPTNDRVPNPLWIKLFKAINPICLIRFIRRKMEEKFIASDAAIADKKRGFADFREKYIESSEKVYISYEQLRDDPPDAACYITGSDQVWNQYDCAAWKLANVNRAYFLDFGAPEVKRLSYAASWGSKVLRNSNAAFVAPLLKAFSAVSVRESSGKALCAQCGRRDARVVLDPTLLLDAADYREIAAMPAFQLPGKYILLYSLGNKSSVSDDDIIAWAKRRGKKVVYVTGNFKRTNYPQCQANTQEWLWLVDHAECVITNSYHCCLFSFVFGRPFAFNRLVGFHFGQNDRLMELGSWMDIRPHVFSRVSDLDREFASEPQNERVSAGRSQSFDFLLNAMGGDMV